MKNLWSLFVLARCDSLKNGKHFIIKINAYCFIETPFITK